MQAPTRFSQSAALQSAASQSAVSLAAAPPRRAFTLTELLVVIVIISMLAAMVSVGVSRAFTSVKATRIKTEGDAIDMAMKAYKEKFGEYPPTDLTQSNDVVIKRHVARAFPRYNLNDFSTDIVLTGVFRGTGARPDQALVFWLQGFSSDPLHPFVTPGGKQIETSGGTASATVQVQRTPLFDFDKARLGIVPNGSNTDSLSYFPAGAKFTTGGAVLMATSESIPPYIYWDANSYGTPPTTSVPTASPKNVLAANWGFTNAGSVMPYGFDVNGNSLFDVGETWANPDSFQIISAGLDAKFGEDLSGATPAKVRLYPTFPANANFSFVTADEDNTTNFCNKSRVGDAKP